MGPKNFNTIVKDSIGHGLKGSGRTSKCPLRVDEGLPLNSALALTSPAGGSQDSGLLQAWGIFEGMRLDADLVAPSQFAAAL